MAVSLKEVRRIARLARLQLSEEEEERLAGEMGRILNYVEKLGEVDTTGAPPMTHGLDLSNVFRSDKPEKPLSREEVLENAPDTDDAHIRVPKAVG